MRLNLVNTGVRYNATDVRLDSGKALDKTLSPGIMYTLVACDARLQLLLLPGCAVRGLLE